MVTELKVMCSAAGWYIGTGYIEEEGYEVPNSRESGYFATRKEAEEELARWELYFSQQGVN